MQLLPNRYLIDYCYHCMYSEEIQLTGGPMKAKHLLGGLLLAVVLSSPLEVARGVTAFVQRTIAQTSVSSTATIGVRN